MKKMFRNESGNESVLITYKVHGSNMRKLFSSESVSEGHPDKVCDQISDAVLDACLAQDKNSRVACEVFATSKEIIISGEITTTAKIDCEKIARKVLTDIGYSKKYFLDPKTFPIRVTLNKQSPDINMGVDKKNKEIGAGDQGIMFGFASNETKEYMPLAITLAHALLRKLASFRKNNIIKDIGPDAKSQVTIDYSNIDKPVIDNILISTQHAANKDLKILKKELHEKIMQAVAKEYHLNTDFDYLVNPTGRFVIGGPVGDTGLTGRKIIVDTYGGYGRHGGGAFSGKDATKVDRSAAYMCRYIAKNVVAAGLARTCEIQVAYAIGKPDPVSIAVNVTGNKKTEEQIVKAIMKTFPLSVKGIIQTLQLTNPIYSQLAKYGHMGREDLNVPWEKLDKVNELKKNL